MFNTRFYTNVINFYLDSTNSSVFSNSKKDKEIVEPKLKLIYVGLSGKFVSILKEN